MNEGTGCPPKQPPVERRQRNLIGPCRGVGGEGMARGKTGWGSHAPQCPIFLQGRLRLPHNNDRPPVCTSQPDTMAACCRTWGGGHPHVTPHALHPSHGWRSFLCAAPKYSPSPTRGKSLGIFVSQQRSPSPEHLLYPVYTQPRSKGTFCRRTKGSRPGSLILSTEGSQAPTQLSACRCGGCCCSSMLWRWGDPGSGPMHVLLPLCPRKADCAVCMWNEVGEGSLGLAPPPPRSRFSCWMSHSKRIPGANAPPPPTACPCLCLN